MSGTPLDAAHARMAEAPDDDALRLAFYRTLAETEIFVLLDAEPVGDSVLPAIFETSEGRVALAFDSEERLAGFAGGPAPYAAMPGRLLAAALEGRDTGLGLNLDVAPSSVLLPPTSLAWLAGVLAPAPEAGEARPDRLLPPDLPEDVVGALDGKLARMERLARRAWLMAGDWPDGRRTHLVIFEDARRGSEAALARAVREAVVLSGRDGLTVDIVFLAAGDPVLARAARVGLRFDLPPLPQGGPPPGRPGGDPSKPPKLV